MSTEAPANPEAEADKEPKAEDYEEEEKQQFIDKKILEEFDFEFGMLADKSNDKEVKVELIPTLFRRLGLSITDSELKELNKKAGVANPGENVKKEKVKDLIYEKCKQTDTLEEMIEALSVFDVDKDGKIPVADFRYAMVQMGEKMREDEVDKMIEAAPMEKKEVKSGDTVTEVRYILVEDYAYKLMNIEKPTKEEA